MQTRSSSKFVSESSSNPISTNSKHRNRRRSKPRVEPFSIPIVTMADNRTMKEMLQAPTKGYGDAIVVPDILAENFEIKTGLLSLIQANKFHSFESNNPHDHIRSFNSITSTLKFRDVPKDAIKLMLFPYSLEGAAKFETFREAWERYKEMLRQCLHHEFSKLHQIDTFYNGLNKHEQDSLNAATGGNLLRKTALDALTIIENKSKVRYSRNKPVAFKVSTTSSGNSSSTDARIDKLTDTISNLVETFNKKMTTPATVKAVEETCVICGGAHPYYDCIATDSNILSAYTTTGIYNQGNTGFCPQDTASTLGSGFLPSNTVAYPRGDLKAITTRSGVSYNGPPIPASTSSKMPEVTMDTKLPEKLGDPSKFLIPCDFPELDECLALADLSASINLMPLSIWRKLSLPELTSTQMILELADRSTTRPAGIAEDVFVKTFLRTGRALIDIYGKELTLRVDDEAITFKVGQTSKYSYNDAELINQIDVIDVACEEYVQEVLGFSDKSKSGNPTLIFDPVISLSFPSLTSFEGGDFILEEIEACLTSKSISPGINDTEFNLEGDTRLLEELLNKDPSSSPLPLKELNVEEIKTVKSFIDEPPKLELKELPSHLEYAFLEGTDKLPVIISKELKDEEKSALLKKDHFLLPFMDQMIERLAENEFYCFLDEFFGYFHILIDPQDQEKTIFTCPYGMFAYRHMPFGLCNAPGMFQRCMMAIFHDMIEKTMEVFMDDFSVFGDSFSSCLSHLDKILQRCEDTNLVLNWEKCHFMVKEGIVLGHKISKSRIEVDRAKVNVIAKLPYPTFVKVLSKTIVYTDHSALKYLLAKQDAKPRLLWWILLLQEFYVIIRDKKRSGESGG
nr:reverse transcriptase domain-containing protein [Tanacetum cinerariifolium]